MNLQFSSNLEKKLAIFFSNIALCLSNLSSLLGTPVAPAYSYLKFSQSSLNAPVYIFTCFFPLCIILIVSIVRLSFAVSYLFIHPGYSSSQIFILISRGLPEAFLGRSRAKWFQLRAEVPRQSPWTVSPKPMSVRFRSGGRDCNCSWARENRGVGPSNHFPALGVSAQDCDHSAEELRGPPQIPEVPSRAALSSHALQGVSRPGSPPPKAASAGEIPVGAGQCQGPPSRVSCPSGSLSSVA